MPTQAKIDIVSEVQGKLESSSGVYFADYKGLSVAKLLVGVSVAWSADDTLLKVNAPTPALSAPKLDALLKSK